MSGGTLYQRAKSIYLEVCELGAERDAALARLCDGDQQLREEVEELLRFDPGDEGHRVSDHAPTLALESGVSSSRIEALSAGQKIGPYRIESKLGQGGMGVVYRARDERLGRALALKFLNAAPFDDPQSQQRFLREARMASSLDHPNICTVYDIGETEGGDAYLAMAFYDGETLAERLADGPLEVREAVAITRQVASGLAAAHSAGVIHRDIKPGNIITSGGVAKILDFGLAKPQHDASMTKTGMHLGTPNSMAPEQARGRPSDARTDVWAVGALLYELLTGARPFVADSIHSLLYSIVHEPHPPLLETAPAIPEQVAAIVDRCLEKDPADRYANAGDLADALVSAQAALEDVAPLEAPTFPSRKIAAAVLALLSIASGAYFFARSPSPPADDLEASGPSPRTAWAGTSTTDVASPDAQAVDSLAILPFLPVDQESADSELERGDAELATLAMALAQRITHGLTPIEDLRVIAHDSVKQTAGRGLTREETARQLGARYLLLGKIESRDDQIEVSAELIEAESQRALWGNRFAVPRLKLAQLEDRIVGETANALSRRIESKKQEFRDPEAYRLLLIGSQKMGTPEALEPLQKAVSIDPTYVDAWTALARTYAYLGYFGLSPREAVYPAAVAAAENALDLDPDSPEALAANSQAIVMARGDIDTGLLYARRAVEKGPGSAFAHYTLGNGLINSDRGLEGIEHLQRALELNPLWPSIRMMMAKAYLRHHRWTEAIEVIRENLAIHPRFPPTREKLLWALYFSGEKDEAIALIRESPLPNIRWWLPVLESSKADALAYLGQETRILQEQGVATTSWQILSVSAAYALLGQEDSALDLMEALKAPQDRLMIYQILHEPAIDPLRDSPRFAALLEDIGAASSFTRVGGSAEHD